MRYPVGRPSVGAAEAACVNAVLGTGWITQGETVKKFEAVLAAHLRVRHVVACSSGTAALHLALAASGIGPNDEVLVPDLTYVATANAVSYTGATPVLVDVNHSWGISLADAAQHVSARTRAILPVHLYGVPCDMDAVNAFAAEHGLFVIEDACEALGANWHGEPCGTMGLCGTFSFYANKIITTGEGGAVVTDDDTLADTLRFLRGQAQSPVRRFWHSEIGFNYRMTEIQAAIGLAQMRRLPDFLEARHAVVDRYRGILSGSILSPMDARSAPWLYTGLLPVGQPYHLGIEERMAARDIEVRPAFVPMHRLPMYARPDAQFPVASLIGDFGISLPTYPDLTMDDVDYIAASLMEVIGAATMESIHG